MRSELKLITSTLPNQQHFPSLADCDLFFASRHVPKQTPCLHKHVLQLLQDLHFTPPLLHFTKHSVARDYIHLRWWQSNDCPGCAIATKSLDYAWANKFGRCYTNSTCQKDSRHLYSLSQHSKKDAFPAILQTRVESHSVPLKVPNLGHCRTALCLSWCTSPMVAKSCGQQVRSGARAILGPTASSNANPCCAPPHSNV